jgi:hypothetical protein
MGQNKEDVGQKGPRLTARGLVQKMQTKERDYRADMRLRCNKPAARFKQAHTSKHATGCTASQLA